MTSHLTESELSALSSSGLSTKAPYIIRGASRSQFSVARHYGGCHAYGCYYTYIPPTDELIRGDVLKWIEKERRREKQKKLAEAKEKQGGLWGEIGT